VDDAPDIAEHDIIAAIEFGKAAGNARLGVVLRHDHGG
jgi:hypothetical protein